MRRETHGGARGQMRGECGNGGLAPCVQEAGGGGGEGVELHQERVEAESIGGGGIQLQLQDASQGAATEQPQDRDGHSVELTSSERTTCYFKGYKYAKAWASKRKIVYHCSKYRAGCKGKMEYTIAAMGYASVRAHTCRDNMIAASSIRDVEDEMKAAADRLAVEHRDWRARDVWENLRQQFYDDDSPDVVRGLSESQVISRVNHARHQHYSANVHGMIETPPLSLALDESVPFFQFHYATMNRKDLTKPTRLVGWAHPSLVALLRYHGTTLFVDGTFRCVPRGYEQCVVFMVHDRASGVYVPVYYILSTSKTEDAYWDMVHFVVQGTDQQIEPAEIICDFESALMNALQTQFPNALVIGCLFHMKQALRRAMKRYAIPEECSIAMCRGVLDTLTVIERSHVERGIEWVKREIKTELNSRFPTPHPSMATFVTVIKTISAEYVRRVSDVPRGRANRVPRERIELPEPVDIPSDIDSDVDESMEPSPDAPTSDTIAI